MTPHTPSFEDSVSRAIRTLTTVVIILALFLGASLGVAGYAVIRGSQALDRAHAVATAQGREAHRAAALATAQGREAHQAAALASLIAAERSQTILRNCREQNARHIRTLGVLDQLLAKAERVSPPLRRAQLRESRASTTLLIDQLAPLENCQQQLAASKRTH